MNRREPLTPPILIVFGVIAVLAGVAGAAAQSHGYGASRTLAGPVLMAVIGFVMVLSGVIWAMLT